VGASENKVGIRDLAPGLWIWRARHPFWVQGDDWQPVVTSTFVESEGERIVVDPLAPALDHIGLWERLDKSPPTVAIVTMPDHVRDIDMFVRRFNAKPFGPMFFFPDDLPRTAKLEPIMAGSVLPGGLVALFDGRGRLETPLWLPQHRTIVFGDALTERNGELRVWDSGPPGKAGDEWHPKRELPALRAMLELPFEQIIISHCDSEPVQTREEFEKALERPPWRG